MIHPDVQPRQLILPTLKKFEKLNVKILGVSKDSIKKHHKFTQKHNLAIELVSDEDGKVCEMFGVWVEKSMYGKIHGN